MFESLSRSLLWRGILALIVGILAIAWPHITLDVLVVLFAVVTFGGAIIQALRAIEARHASAVVGHVLVGLIGVAAGVIAVVWPGITLYVLVICVGVWAFVLGVLEVGLIFVAGESASERLLFALGGLLAAAFGVVLLVRPDIGAITLAELFGLFNLIFGISSLVMSANVKDAGDSITSFFR